MNTFKIALINLWCTEEQVVSSGSTANELITAVGSGQNITVTLTLLKFLAIFLARILTVPILRRKLCFFLISQKKKKQFMFVLLRAYQFEPIAQYYTVYNIHTGSLYLQAESWCCCCQSSCFSLTKLQSDWKTIIIRRTCCVFLRDTIMRGMHAFA